MARDKTELSLLLQNIKVFFEEESGQVFAPEHLRAALLERQQELIRAFVVKRLGHLKLEDLMNFNRLLEEPNAVATAGQTKSVRRK